MMSPAAPLPVTPSPAYNRRPDADGVRDVEAAAVTAPRAVVFQVKDLGAIARLAAWTRSLPPQLGLRARPPSSRQSLPTIPLARAATRGGRSDAPARRVEQHRPPAVSAGECQPDARGDRRSDAVEDTATPLGASPPSESGKKPFLSTIRKRKAFRAPPLRPSTNPAEERRGRVEAALGPLFDAGPFVLVCTGDPESAVVVPVAVGENADAVDQWTAIRDASRAHVSRWRSWVAPARLELVTIRIVGPDKSREKAFRGTFEPVDVAARLSLLREQASQCERYITEPVECAGSFELRCYHDTSKDFVMHGDFCGDPEIYVDLSYEVRDQRERLEEISKLELVPTWPLFLADPSLAWGNDPLIENWIYHSKSIMPSPHGKVIHSAAQIEFTGFRLSEWPYRQDRAPRPLVVGGMVTFCGIIIVTRVVYGDWGVAYTAGAFFVALAELLSTWVAGQQSNPGR
ncbi:hypothetical protein LX36DRAFT_751159 [Colletotrichum falcatum]|nr:hypothetical protein LX36DRAFT_751159 [Colletotrichum falcatum]